ncbi:TetR/AcrR family transcriptional regulator [Paenibacillus sp. R14(2021)]|uniref:TetR/AcrR family transcriptional regulator n=1 Tax=Paenibacillus sp. R14(2021) TaxID=2859228 RepID=UPI001C614262|nr:TetR/AcrR family transcriptional regulator [Paenibacillus sp. R14(2021)]
MSIVKQNIMDSAERLFSEKGYLATSIQDIADDCKIAKGSLYKFFPSKEDLFVEVHHSKQDSLFEKMEEIRLDPALTLREIFIREIECQFYFFIENNFIVKNSFEMQASEGKIASILLSQRVNIFNMNRDALTRRFGKEIELNIWDLVLIYNGIVKEYLFLIIFDNRPFNIRDVSVFIADLLEEVVVGVLNKKPKAILENAMMDNYVESARKGNSVTVVEQRRRLFELLFSTLKELAITNYHKTELHEALVILQEEVERDQPRSVLILAMLQFLKKEHELTSIIEQLRKLCFNMGE